MRAVVRPLAALAVVALLALPARADQVGLAHAHDVLRQLREIRAAKADERISPLLMQKFGHHLKEPVRTVETGPATEPEKYPDLKPTGTMRVGGQLRVVAGTATYAVGDEVEDGWRVLAITPKKLTIRKGQRTKDYRIP